MTTHGEEQIILIKKKAGHGGHHGGAWKVAYADFVTAMMALFIVLWLMNSSKPVQEAVGGYFRDPKGNREKGFQLGWEAPAQLKKKRKWRSLPRPHQGHGEECKFREAERPD